jgi:hypothetical protein
MIRCYASDAPELYRLAIVIAQLANPVLFWDMKQMDDLERRAALAEAVAAFEELIS